MGGKDAADRPIRDAYGLVAVLERDDGPRNQGRVRLMSGIYVIWVEWLHTDVRGVVIEIYMDNVIRSSGPSTDPYGDEIKCTCMPHRAPYIDSQSNLSLLKL